MVNKIKNVKTYCCENIRNIENYDEAVNSNKRYVCHHRLETHNSDGERRIVPLRMEELIALGMYYNRPASELVFMSLSEHSKLHGPFVHKGCKASPELRNKLSDSHKGKKHSEEHKIKISETLKGRSHHSYTKGRKWFNNGIINKMCYECPPGFVPGRIRWLTRSV